MRITHVGPMMVALALALPGCGDLGGRDGDAFGPDADQQEVDVEPSGMNEMFAAAAEEFDVPVEILKTVAYAETQWQTVTGDPEFDGKAAIHGVMGLSDDRLDSAAELAGVEPELASTDALENIRAAAAWLSSEADRLELVDRADLGSWADTVASYSGIEDDIARSTYVYQSIYAVMRTGFVVETADGDVRGELAPTEAWPAFTVPPPAPAVEAGPDYAGSLWRPSPNFNNRPGGDIGEPGMVIIHTCEGSYAGCWGWLKNSASGVSAHYVVKEDGKEITQLVRESKRAWHISAKYNCNNNSSKECWRNNNSSNHFTVGIEHAGFSNQASWNPNLIDASAKLVCDITRDQGIPRDRFHVLGHGQLQPANRTDPGPNWPWDEYYDLIDAHCNGGAPPPAEPPPAEPPPPGESPDAIIIDSNNANNDANLGFMSQSNNWFASSGSSEKYESGYWYASTEAVSDPATFWFFADEAGSRTVDAWWASGANRSATAPFVVFDDSGTARVVKVDQRTNGGQWNELGTWTFAAGWNKVQLSRWTSGDAVVIADALRVRK